MNYDELKNISDNCELMGDKIVLKTNLLKTLEFIKNKYKFDMLKSITAIDEKEKGIELVYNLYSVENDEEVLVSIFTKIGSY